MLKAPDGSTLLMCKGADSVMTERITWLAGEEETTAKHLTGFSKEGLRTLVMAQREISEKEL